MKPRVLRNQGAAPAAVALCIACLVVLASAQSRAWASDEARALPLQGSYARASYVWPHETGPYYGHLPAATPSAIVTPVGHFSLFAELPIPDALRTPNRLAAGASAQYFIVQAVVDPARRSPVIEQVESSGGQVVGRAGIGAVVARLTAASHAAIRQSFPTAAVEPYHAAFKLHPLIGRVPLTDPAAALSKIYRLDVLLWSGEDASDTARSLTQLGVKIVRTAGEHVVVEADASLLTAMAQLEPVKLIVEVLPRRLAAEETTTTMQTGGFNAGAVPYHDAGVDGSGGGFGFCAAPDPAGTGCRQSGDCPGSATCVPAQQILLVLDTGIQLDAGDLADRRTDAGAAGPTHRKVRVYETAETFGGGGDLLGCDDAIHGGVTHGHMVAATALGRATRVDPQSYGDPFFAYDLEGNAWKLDGVAPGAALVAYDADVTPPAARCSDPLRGELDVGEIYDALNPLGSSFGSAYLTHGARVFVVSWGAEANAYLADAIAIDGFMADHDDALVVIAAGNRSTSTTPDDFAETLIDTATSKNGLVVGASGTADTTAQQESRAFFSSAGPAINSTINRVAPLVMAPGAENVGGVQGVSSEFACRSSDNDQLNPVECDLARGQEGTSLSAAATAGAALLVRDYFAQGFYPSQRAGTADQVEVVSGALVKAILAASADFMTGENLTLAHRFNNEQGYGRLQLDNALPLETWPASPSGLLVHDPLGGVDDPALQLQSILQPGDTTGAAFEVCSNEQELRIMLAWTDPVETAGALINDLDLVVTSPTLKEYRGNYFSDDNNRNGVPDLPPEDCPGIGETVPNQTIDQGAFSLPACSNSGVPGASGVPTPFDSVNPTEGVFLSPDPHGNGSLTDGTCKPLSPNPGGIDGQGSCADDLDCGFDPEGDPDLANDRCEGGTRQPEQGIWTVSVSAKNGNLTGQDFALIIVGGVCRQSAVTLSGTSFACNDAPVVTVTERADAADPACPAEGSCPASVIQGRTTMRAIDGTVEEDCEGPGCAIAGPGPSFVDAGGLIFRSEPIELTDGTIPEPGNGVLEVRDGNTVEVVYEDSDGLRRSVSPVTCQISVSTATAVFAQFGQDTATRIEGGCERARPRHETCVKGTCRTSGLPCFETADCPLEGRGFFELGSPDRYMDAGELLQFHFAFSSTESTDLQNVAAALSCVAIDADSPLGCSPDGAGCTEQACGGACDPRRENNPPCPWMSVLDSPQQLGLLPAQQVFATSFAVQLADEATFAGSTPTVEMLLQVTAENAGRTRSALIVDRQRLNVDATEIRYNTDFPGGGRDIVFDFNNNEKQDDPITDPSMSGLDGLFETRNYSDLTAGLDAQGQPVARNSGLGSPWNFDGGDGGFRNGLAWITDADAPGTGTLANWGEDRNFNGIEDGVCLADATTACYDFPADPRCPGAGLCRSLEDANMDSVFTQNHNARGGCGWVTRAPSTCTLDSGRSCFVDADCAGNCARVGNPVVSTAEACGVSVGGTCPTVRQCEDGSPENPRAACQSQADCGGGSCVEVAQSCVADAGTCAGASATTGGVWHTGAIGDRLPPGGDCAPQCADYAVIQSSGGESLWWELLLTPVIEKVDQRIGADGLKEARAEIVQMGWNGSEDLADNKAALTWEFDTNAGSVFPVDLIADGTVLGVERGPTGAVSGTGGPLFAAMSRCKATGGACVDDADCLQGQGECLGLGTCEQSNDDCVFDLDCLEGFCNVTTTRACVDDTRCRFCTGSGAPCFSDAHCQGGSACEIFETCVLLHNTCVPSAADGVDCAVDADCQAIDSDATCLACVPSATSVTGDDSQGNNRPVQNSCFFEGDQKIRPENSSGLRPPAPLDDDLDQDQDGLIDEFVTPSGPRRNRDLGLEPEELRQINLEDLFGETGDTFQAAFGIQNFEGTINNPAERSFGVAIDDVYVEWKELVLGSDETTCETGSCAVLSARADLLFQADVVIPVSLLDSSAVDNACTGGPRNNQLCFPAQPDCPGGLCALAGNDCDLDGVFRESVQETAGDCNANGIPDRPVRASSDVDEQVLILDRVAGGSGEFRGTLTTSIVSDAGGALRVGQFGVTMPRVDLTYADNEDGTGHACQNSAVPELQGVIRSSAAMAVPNCDVTIENVTITDNGDGDGTPDTNETVAMSLEVKNECSEELTGCTVRLSTNSPEVECITVSSISLGDLPVPQDDEAVPLPAPFVFKISATADRDELGLSADEGLSANFGVTVQCDQIDGTRFPQELSFPLDLNIDDFGQTPTTWSEDFEDGTLAKFEAQNNDEGIPGNNNAEGRINGQGWRCQFNSPDWVNGSAYDRNEALSCFPAQTLSHAAKVYWQVDGATVAESPDGGRAKSGQHSMYYGVFLPADASDTGRFTTPLGTIEGAGTIDPVNLGTGSPKLSFWHQISLLDTREVGGRPGRSHDRGVIQIQLADRETGAPSGPWMKLQPIQNAYAIQSESNYFNCMYDPIDDGNTEYDFFDPADPDRETGPSSTCFPEFVYSWLGDTDEPFSVGNVGRATTRPAATDSPSLGVGTWVETVVDLAEFRGRAARFRFLVGTIKAGTSETIHGLFGNQNEGDDGWWIDDVLVDDVLAVPAEFINDNADLGTCSSSGAPCIGQCRSSFASCTDASDCGATDGDCVLPCGAGEGVCSGPPPDCGAECSSVVANVFVTPDELLSPGTITTPAPGQTVTLNTAAAFDPETGAEPSVAGPTCFGGVLQYRFCVSGDPDGGGPALPNASCDDVEDQILRTWSASSVLARAPESSESLAAEARCATKTDCVGAHKVDVIVTCPGGVDASGLADLRTVNDSGALILQWSGAPLDVDVYVSDAFGQLGGIAGYPGTTSSMSGAVSLDISGDLVPAGRVVGYLVRAQGPKNTVDDGFFCNSRTWRSGGAAEIAEDDAERGFGRDTNLP